MLITNHNKLIRVLSCFSSFPILPLHSIILILLLGHEHGSYSIVVIADNSVIMHSYSFKASINKICHQWLTVYSLLKHSHHIVASRGIEMHTEFKKSLVAGRAL